MKIHQLLSIARRWPLRLLAGCATAPSPAELDAQAGKAIKASFRDQGIAKVDRLNQDLGQQACSSDKAPDDAVADADQGRGLELGEVARRRPVPRRLARGREAGPERPRHDLDRRVARHQRPTAATATTATRSTRRKSPTAPSARACGTTARCAASPIRRRADRRRRSCSTPGSRCGTPRPIRACSNMPRFGHKSCSTSSRCATSWPCCSTRSRRSTSRRLAHPAACRVFQPANISRHLS